ncbi:hypothetical protein [Thermomonospora cellulosilytica]|uniref:Uncharacterized protein n=1 Tax=Thermomonospora cellulosilytica TaxID=1411118 RepID=A0A7W3MTF6_9ACTN|nr:hypothetical protein [Thermomonospora cellulosilytica]MBA9001581.1 hypothetical protein [Thermomonospora cellulosilytica]
MTHEVVLTDAAKDGRTVLVGCLLMAALMFVVGFNVDGGFRIALFVVGGLAAVFALFVVSVILSGAQQRLLLDRRGLVHARGERAEVLPAEAIRSVGLLVDGDRTTFLVVSYDPAIRERLPRSLRGYEIRPGLLRLGMVGDDGFGFIPLARIAEARRVVQTCGLGEWRDHS